MTNSKQPSSPNPCAQHRVVVMGGANMDIAASTDVALVIADSNPGRIRCSPGGVARNVAENLARLGHDAHLISAVGNDEFGRNLLKSTREAGVHVQSTWVLPGEATSAYLSLHGPDGDMAVAVNDMRILECLTPDRLATQVDRLSHAQAVVVDCNLPPSALAWLFAHVGAAPVFVDCVSAFKCLRIQPWLGAVHTLKLNQLEAQALSGKAVNTDAGIEQAAQWLHQQGTRQVVISLGERGVYWSCRGGEWGGEDAGEAANQRGFHPALSVPVRNVTGAGDALMAGLVHAFLQRKTLMRAIPFALGCAALTVSSDGANHPNLSASAVEQLLQSSSS